MTGGRRCWNGVVSLGAEFKNRVLDADAADGADAGATAELRRLASIRIIAPAHDPTHQLTVFLGLRYERLDAAGPKKECTHRRELGAVCVPVMNSQFCSSAVLQFCKLFTSASCAVLPVLPVLQFCSCPSIRPIRRIRIQSCVLELRAETQNAVPATQFL
jgi:hypothetical protein